MSTPFLGQIQSFAFNFAPRGWALCDGQTLPVQQYAALYSLLGTMYGGNGTTTFNLPNLQSRVPMHFGTSPGGNSYTQGEQGGEENVTLLYANLPLHSHPFLGSATGANDSAPILHTASAPITNAQGGTPGNYYAAPASLQSLNPASVSTTGGAQPHANIQPYLTINWCIAMTGEFPAHG